MQVHTVSERQVPFRDWFTAHDIAIPVLPSIASRVIELAADPDVPVAQLARIVSKDQVLAARVLGFANSAYCSPMQEISSVTEAIVRMGTGAVRNVVVTVCFSSRMHDPAVYGGAGQTLIEHGIGTAYLARLVADQAGVPEDEAFLYGLLHDIGKLVLLKLAHDHRRRTGAAVPAEELQAVVAQHHAMMGGLALRRWKLPMSLDEPVMCHHDYRSAAVQPRKAAVAYLANRLSHLYGFGCEKEEFDVLADPVCAELGVDEPWLQALGQRAPGLFEVARQMFT